MEEFLNNFYKYLTGYYYKQDTFYAIVYDFAWMEFPDGEVLILRRKPG